MKVRTLSVDGFGALNGRTFDIEGDVVVVCGRNERGKSSFRSALRTLLFGFSPASFEKHPLASIRRAPEGVDDELATRIAGTLELDGSPGSDRAGAEAWRVERAFAPHPVQRMHPVGDDAPAPRRGNTKVPGVGSLNGSLYDAAYSIDATDVRTAHRVDAGLERILLGDDAAPRGVSVIALRREVDAERAKLWKRSRRSNATRVAALDEEIARAAQEARAARKIERSLLDLERDALERRDGLARRLAEREGLEQDLARLHLIERVARVVRAGEALEGIELEALDDLPLEPPGPLLAELEDAELALEEPRQRLARPAPPFDERDRRTLEQAAEIEGLARSEREVERCARDADAARARSAERERAALEIERAAFARPGRGVELDRLREVRIGAERWAESRETGGPPDRPGKDPRAVGIGATIAGLAAGGSALALDWPWLAAAAAAILPAVSVLAVRPRGAGASPGSSGPAQAPPALTRALDAAGLDRDLARSPERVVATVESLVHALSLRDEADVERSRSTELQRAIESTRERWRHLAETLGVALSGEGPVDGAPDRLRERLAEARRRAEAARVDALERQRAGRELGRAEARLAELTRRFEALQGGLRRAVPDELGLERAHGRAARALAERERQRGALRELALDPAWHAALEDPAFSRARRDGSIDLAELRAAEARVQQAALGIEAEREALARMDERLERERPSRTPSEVDSELEELARERQTALDEHDRLALLSAVLAAGEEAHRREHQPKVLARASAWMRAITAGRYPRIEYESAGEGGSGLVLVRSGAAAPVGAGHSRGVREQAHLCVRLAAAEALDEGQETLPLLLDEALVHWDEARRNALYPVLARLRGQRQVFLFTCHEALAGEAVAALDAQRIDL